MTADRTPIMIDGIEVTPCGTCAWCTTRPAEPTFDQGSGPGPVPAAPRDSCYARALHAAALAKAGLTEASGLW